MKIISTRTHEIIEGFFSEYMKGCKIQIPEGIGERGDVKFSRKKYEVFDIELCPDNIRFWVSNNKKCHIQTISNITISLCKYFEKNPKPPIYGLFIDIMRSLSEIKMLGASEKHKTAFSNFMSKSKSR